MDNRTIEEIKANETKLIEKIKELENENRKYKKVINKLRQHLQPIYAKRGYCSAKEILIFLAAVKEE